MAASNSPIPNFFYAAPDFFHYFVAWIFQIFVHLKYSKSNILLW